MDPSYHSNSQQDRHDILLTFAFWTVLFPRQTQMCPSESWESQTVQSQLLPFVAVRVAATCGYISVKVHVRVSRCWRCICGADTVDAASIWCSSINQAGFRWRCVQSGIRSSTHHRDRHKQPHVYSRNWIGLTLLPPAP